LHIWMLVNSYRCSTGGSRFSRCAGESHNHQLNEFPRYHELIHTFLKSFEMYCWIILIDYDAIRVLWISSTHLCTVQEFRLFNFMDSCLHCLRFSKCIVILCYIMYVHMISVVASDVTVYVRACVRACVRESVCVYLCVHVRMRVCVCAHACEHLITIHVLHRKLVVNGVLVYIHDAHIRLGIGFAGTCMLQCVAMCTAVCTEVCCSVLHSRLYPRRARSPWQWLCWYICVAMCIAVCPAVCCSVLQYVAF